MKITIESNNSIFGIQTKDSIFDRIHIPMMDIILLLLVLWFIITSLYIACWIIGRSHKQFFEFLDDTMAPTTLMNGILGTLIFGLGIAILYLQLIAGIDVKISAGISIVALGIAILSFALAQEQKIKSKSELKEIRNLLKSISKKIDRIDP
jgi:hypothetical protein